MATKEISPRPRQTVMVEWIYLSSRTVGLLGLVGALALGGFIYWKFFRSPPTTGRDQAVAAVAAAERAVGDAAVRDPDAALLTSARGHIETARRDLESSDFGRAIDEAHEAEKIAGEIVGASGEDNDPSVRVARAAGEVRIKRAGQFNWEPAGDKTVMRPGDQIRTAGDGTAELVYFDGTRVTVSSGSLLEIRELYRDAVRREQRVSERLEFGTLNAATGQKEGITTLHEVSTEEASVRTKRAAQFQIHRPQGVPRSEVVTYQGQVSLETGGRIVEVPESTQIAVSDGKIVDKATILDAPKLLLPPDEKAFLAPRETSVELAWATLERAAFYHLQVALHPGFSQPLHDLAELTSPHAELPALTPQTYYWRVAAIDREGRVGRWSDARKFRILGADFKDLDDTTPPRLRLTEVLVVGTNAIITGFTEPGTLVWIEGERAEVDDQGKFTWVVKLREDGENKLQILAQDAAGNEAKALAYAHVDVF